MPDGVPSLGFGGALTSAGRGVTAANLARAPATKSIYTAQDAGKNLTSLAGGQAGIAGGQALTPTPEPQVGDDSNMLMKMFRVLTDQEGNRNIMEQDRLRRKGVQ